MLVYALHLFLQPVVCYGLRLSVLNSWIKKLYLPYLLTYTLALRRPQYFYVDNVVSHPAGCYMYHIGLTRRI